MEAGGKIFFSHLDFLTYYLLEGIRLVAATTIGSRHRLSHFRACLCHNGVGFVHAVHAFCEANVLRFGELVYEFLGLHEALLVARFSCLLVQHLKHESSQLRVHVTARVVHC